MGQTIYQVIFGMVRKQKKFLNKVKILAHCKNDVKIPRQACRAFKKLLLKLVKKIAVRQAIKLLSICNKVIRTMILKPDNPERDTEWETAKILKLLNDWRTLVRIVAILLMP